MPLALRNISMKPICGIIFATLLLLGCKTKSGGENLSSGKREFNQELANELKKMAVIDQIAAYIPQGEYKKLTLEEWKAFKDSVYTTHQKRISAIFDVYGFVGFDLAGKEGSENFWLMVQHSDHNPKFQKKVLQKMKLEVEKGNASPKNYAYLVDRVKLNTGQQQIYGTQFSYNELGQAYPKNLFDSLNIDKRRKSVGLNSMLDRMNEMTTSHFLMNKEYFAKKGIKEPKLYQKE